MRRRSSLGNFSRGPSVLTKRGCHEGLFHKPADETWLLIVVPAVVIAYPVARVVVPAVVHAVVPEVVRTVLSVI